MNTTNRKVRRILVGLLKGGPGKTSVCWFLANALAREFPELRVVVICADRRTKTLRKWYAAAVQASCGGDADAMPFVLVEWRGEEEHGPLSTFATATEAEYAADIVLTDVGGEQRDVFMSALLWCNLLLSPVGTSPLELIQVPETLEAAKAVGAYSPLEMIMILNRVTHPHRGRARNARAWLTTTEATEQNPMPCGLDVMDTEIKFNPTIYVDQWAALPDDLADFPALARETMKVEI